MSKPSADLSNFVEDVRVTIRNNHATYVMTAYPADLRTKDWINTRQKASTSTREGTVAPSELQWCSLGLLEFMEVDGCIWTEKTRKNQIIFHISMLTPEHIDALQLKIERKHSTKIFREQIQPVSVADFHASIEVKMDRVRRVFHGHVKNTGSIRPLECVFEFNSQSDMQLVLDELNSEDGVTLVCHVSVGGVVCAKTSLSLPKQRLIDANIGSQAFGDNNDYALFTPSQLDEVAQMFVNTITLPEMTSSGGNMADIKPILMTALQPTLLEVQLSPEILAKVSPLNGEHIELHQKYHSSSVYGEDGGEHMHSGGRDDSHTQSVSHPHAHSPSRAVEKHKVTFSSPSKLSSSHKASYKEVHCMGAGGGMDVYMPAPRNANVPADTKLPRHHGAHHSHGHSHGRQAPPPTVFYRLQRSRACENMTLQWFRSMTPQQAIYPPIEIDSRLNISQYNERALRDHPRKVTNVAVIRLPESAWVTFNEPSDSGKGPVDSYTVHAQPIMDVPDERGMIDGMKETREQKYFRKTKISCAANRSPICVQPLRCDVEYRFAVECFNASGASSISEPVLVTARDNDFYSAIPLYGIIPFSGPVQAIPPNFRRLDGSSSGVPNLAAAFTMKSDVVSKPLSLSTSSADMGKTPGGAIPWMGLMFIQRIA
mmetsp:Transcript_21922/g.40858  ORF Transcript_21922/g.40858 Transcript_21922/m.40858 type:complete len:655 (-) Transcript_21922:127-2091(-)